MSSKKKVGFFGGSFDPIHFGHLNLAVSLKEMCGLDEVLFVPASFSPFKAQTPPIASASDRLAMLKIAVAPIHGFQVLDLEVFKEGPSYTIDTVRVLSKDPSIQLHLLMGEDHLELLHRWKEADELTRLAPPLIGARILKTSSSLNIFKIPLFDISSTEIRSRLAQGKYCGHLVPSPVLDYIKKHRLYL